MAHKKMLYVGGLPGPVTEETLISAFIPFGDVTTVTLPRDPQSRKHRGYAFVEFEDAEDAIHAMENMNNAELYGHIVRVNYAKAVHIPSTKPIWEESDEWLERIEEEKKKSEDLKRKEEVEKLHMDK